VPNNSVHKPNSFWLPLNFLVVLLLGMLIGIKLEKEGAIANQTALRPPYSKKIDALFRLLDAKYIHEVHQDKLIQQTINRLKTSDVDTNYIPSKRLIRINEQVDIKPYHR